MAVPYGLCRWLRGGRLACGGDARGLKGDHLPFVIAMNEGARVARHAFARFMVIGGDRGGPVGDNRYLAIESNVNFVEDVRYERDVVLTVIVENLRLVLDFAVDGRVDD